jgi:hypothetical protein
MAFPTRQAHKLRGSCICRWHGVQSSLHGLVSPQQKGKAMATKLIDAETGLEITGQIKMVFVCDMCQNTADFYHGMTTYTKTVGTTITKESYCSEICARKAVA